MTDLKVKLCASPEANADEVFILCRSTARQAKEKAIHDRFIKRLDAGLRRREKSCEDGRIKNVQIAEQRLGRLRERHRRASKFFAVAFKENNGAVQINWSRREPQLTWARLSEGCYVLRSNIKDWAPEELWKAYIQLTDAEAAFRIQKDDLKLRPSWHQKETRVKAHILVCFLA
jgi:transposase